MHFDRDFTVAFGTRCPPRASAFQVDALNVVHADRSTYQNINTRWLLFQPDIQCEKSVSDLLLISNDGWSNRLKSPGQAFSNLLQSVDVNAELGCFTGVPVQCFRSKRQFRCSCRSRNKPLDACGVRDLRAGFPPGVVSSGTT